MDEESTDEKSNTPPTVGSDERSSDREEGDEDTIPQTNIKNDDPDKKMPNDTTNRPDEQLSAKVDSDNDDGEDEDEDEDEDEEEKGATKLRDKKSTKTMNPPPKEFSQPALEQPVLEASEASSAWDNPQHKTARVNDPPPKELSPPAFEQSPTADPPPAELSPSALEQPSIRSQPSHSSPVEEASSAWDIPQLKTVDGKKGVDATDSPPKELSPPTSKEPPTTPQPSHSAPIVEASSSWDIPQLEAAQGNKNMDTMDPLPKEFSPPAVEQPPATSQPSHSVPVVEASSAWDIPQSKTAQVNKNMDTIDSPTMELSPPAIEQPQTTDPPPAELPPSALKELPTTSQPSHSAPVEEASSTWDIPRDAPQRKTAKGKKSMDSTDPPPKEFTPPAIEQPVVEASSTWDIPQLETAEGRKSMGAKDSPPKELSPPAFQQSPTTSQPSHSASLVEASSAWDIPQYKKEPKLPKTITQSSGNRRSFDNRMSDISMDNSFSYASLLSVVEASSTWDSPQDIPRDMLEPKSAEGIKSMETTDPPPKELSPPAIEQPPTTPQPSHSAPIVEASSTWDIPQDNPQHKTAQVNKSMDAKDTIDLPPKELSPPASTESPTTSQPSHSAPVVEATASWDIPQYKKEPKLPKTITHSSRNRRSNDFMMSDVSLDNSFSYASLLNEKEDLKPPRAARHSNSSRNRISIDSMMSDASLCKDDSRKIFHSSRNDSIIDKMIMEDSIGSSRSIGSRNKSGKSNYSFYDSSASLDFSTSIRKEKEMKRKNRRHNRRDFGSDSDSDSYSNSDDDNEYGGNCDEFSSALSSAANRSSHDVYHTIGAVAIYRNGRYVSQTPAVLRQPTEQELQLHEQESQLHVRDEESQSNLTIDAESHLMDGQKSHVPDGSDEQTQQTGQTSSADFPAKDGDDGTGSTPWYRNSMLWVIVGVGTIGLVVAVILVVRMKDESPTMAPTMMPSASPTQTPLDPVFERLIVNKNISDYDAFQDASSPQSKAYDWLLRTDTMTMLSENMNYDQIRNMETRYILAVFFFALSGENWESNQDWLNAEKEHWRWKGIYKRKVGAPNNNDDDPFMPARQIILKGNKMVGTLPKELGHLSELGNIDVPDNKISSVEPFVNEKDPAEFTHLSLKGNPLEGHTSLFRLTNLKNLWLHQTSFEGTLPTDIQALSKLKQLDLSTNRLEGTLTDHFHTMRRLSDLSLSGNPQLKGDLDTILNCTNGCQNCLTFLKLQDTGIRGSFSDHLLGFHKLQVLYVSSSSEFTGTIPTTLGEKLPNLTELKLTNNPSLVGTIPSELSLLTGLTSLEVAFSGLTGSIPDEVCSMGTDLTIKYSRTTMDCSCPGTICKAV